MFLKTLRLHNFRNYQDSTLHFSPGVNVITGANAQGKTNLLEAVSLLSTGRSFRTNFLSELIRKDQSSFLLQAEIIKEDLSESVLLQYDGTNKKLQYNSHNYSSFNNLLGILPSVLYAPTDLALIAGSPSQRRRFMNIHIAQQDPLYVHHLVRFVKAIKQRNALLKKKSQNAMECFENELAISGSYLSFKRLEMVEELRESLSKYTEKLSGEKDLVGLEFIPSFPMKRDLTSIKNSYLNELNRMRNKEFAIGSTLVGPHRDDFVLSLGELDAKSFASEGQKRSLTAALRFAEWDRLTQNFGTDALVCVDDFGVQLDSQRKNFFYETLKGFSQVFITMPENHELFEENEHLKVFRIHEGSVKILETV